MSPINCVRNIVVVYYLCQRMSAEGQFRFRNDFPPDEVGLVGLCGLRDGDCPRMSSATDADDNAGDKRPVTVGLEGDERGREMYGRGGVGLFGS
jgi:hypothetical protein